MFTLRLTLTSFRAINAFEYRWGIKARRRFFFQHADPELIRMASVARQLLVSVATSVFEINWGHGH